MTSELEFFVWFQLAFDFLVLVVLERMSSRLALMRRRLKTVSHRVEVHDV